MNVSRLLWCLLCWLLVLAAAGGAALAAEYLWVGAPGDGTSWVDEDNWAATGGCSAPPGYCYPRTASDDALFSFGISVGTVCLSTQSIDQLTVARTATFDDCSSVNPVLTVHGLTLTSGSAAATFTFSGGAKVQN